MPRHFTRCSVLPHTFAVVSLCASEIWRTATVAPHPGGELAEVHSYLMSAALSTFLPAQLTRLHLPRTNQSALLLYGHQHSTHYDWGWMGETFSITYDSMIQTLNLISLCRKASYTQSSFVTDASLFRFLLNLNSLISSAASVWFNKLIHSSH